MRTVGVILILSACLLIDKAYKERAMHGVRILGELSELFKLIENRLTQHSRPISALISGAKPTELSKLGFISELESGTVPIDAYNSVRKKLGISVQTDALLEDFFTYGCRGTDADMKEKCGGVLFAIGEEYKAAKENATVKTRLLRVVLLSLGLGFAISVI